MTRRPAGILGVAVGLVAGLSLLSTALHANTTATRLVSTQAKQEANFSNHYYDCLSAEGHALLRPHDLAYVAQDNLASWVAVTKAVGGWAHLTEHRTHATVAVLLVSVPRRSGHPTCDGQGLVTIRISAKGRVVMRRATPEATSAVTSRSLSRPDGLSS